MISLLAKFFIKDTMDEATKRNQYGVVCGVAGIILNICLFGFKLFAGLTSGAISIVSDAFNNLSDAGSSIITLVGFKLSGQKPDADHPYGHGRIEYLSGLVVASLILIMGFELFKGSIEKVLNPEPITYSYIIIIILVASILVKCYMAYYNFTIGKKIDSAALNATGSDSLSDCIATSGVLVATLIGYFFKLNIDGLAGCLVSILIFIAGFKAMKETIDPLLGSAPEKEFIEQIEQIVLSFDANVVGLHDLMVHDYGPGRRIISLHAEVPADGDILVLHDIIDNLEKKLKNDLGCATTIHMDPVEVNNPKVASLKQQVINIVKQYDSKIMIHDFRVVFGDTHTNILFDMAMPFSCKMSDEEAKKEVANLIKKEIGENYFAVIEVDRDNYILKED